MCQLFGAIENETLFPGHFLKYLPGFYSCVPKERNLSRFLKYYTPLKYMYIIFRIRITGIISSGPINASSRVPTRV